MIQAPDPREVQYAIRMIAGAAPEARVARAVQSAVAADVLKDLRRAAGWEAGPSSKSHSRSLAAAAVAAEGCVGIDIEYLDPRRDICAVARYLMGADAPDRTSAYRVFTFREAYFKATGEWPIQAQMQDVAAKGAAEFRTRDGLNVQQGVIADVFALSLVWGSVRHQFPRHAERHL